MDTNTTLPFDIDVRSVQRMLANNEITLIDCREEVEHQRAAIEGAVLIPMSQWMQRLSELASLANQRIVVHCHHGGRSARVTQWLRENGYPMAQNMTGGIDAWSDEIDSAVPKY